MKRLMTALLATTCLTAPTPASAEPITIAIASAVGVELIAGSITAAVATFVLTTAVGVGVSMAASAFLTKTDAQAADTSASGSDLSVNYGAALPRSAIMGPGATGGHHVYTNVYGDQNIAMQCVFAIGDGQHGRITRIRYNGKDITLPAGGLGHLDQTSPPEFIHPKYGVPCVILKYYAGRFDQLSDDGLIAQSNPPGRWTAEHRGRGVAYLIVTQFYVEETLDLTGIPQLMIEHEGVLLYDPRKDDTNGGSGAHRWGSPDTYEPSANPAVQEYNFRRGILINGQRVLGMSMSPVNLILQMYFAAANINDEAIPLAEGGTEQRYRCSVTVADDRSAADVISALRNSTAGWSLERGGQFGPVPGVPQIPISSLAFSDDDMIVGESARFTKYRSRSEMITAAFGQFSDPAQFWISTAFPARENTADDAAYGERIAKSIDLSQIYSSSQAQRVAESERRRSLQQGQGVATLPAKWIGVQPGDWLPFNSQRHGSMTVLVTGTTLDTKRQTMTLTFERISNTVYSWTTAGELFPPEFGIPGVPGTIIMSASGMTAVGVNLPGDGGLYTPGIAFSWTPITDPSVDQIDFEIRKLGDTAILPFTAHFPEAGTTVCSGHGIAAATVYEYRHKLYTTPVRDTPWSAWLSVMSGTQHVVPSALSSVPFDKVTLEMFEAGLKDYVATQLDDSFKQLARFEQLIASTATEHDAQARLELHLQKDADVRITGQVSTLSGGKTWRGTYGDTTTYNPDDMVTLAGKLYFTTTKVKGVAPPAAPWVEQFTAAVISNEWRTFAGPDGVAAQTSDSIEVRFGGATLERSLALVISDWKAFAGPDFAAAQSSDSIEARFGGTVLEQSLAQIISQWKAFAGLDFATAQSEQTTLAAIGTNTASISTNTNAIATIDGKLLATWQVTLDVNNYVSGLKFYNNGTVSDFTIITDVFRVAEPAAVSGGAPVPVFQISTVDGVGKIVLRGDMVADGTVTANKIVAGSIKAIHVGANEIVSSAANIKNLVVENIHIKNAQITVANFGTHGGGGINPVGGVTLDVPITVFGVAGSEIVLLVNGGFDFCGAGTFGASNWGVNIVETGTNLDSGAASFDAGPPRTRVSISGGGKVTASGGAQTLTARLSISFGGGNGDAAGVRLAFAAYLR